MKWSFCLEVLIKCMLFIDIMDSYTSSVEFDTFIMLNKYVIEGIFFTAIQVFKNIILVYRLG